MRRGTSIGDQVTPHDIAAEQAIFRVLVLAATELNAVASLAARDIDPQLCGCILWKTIQEDARDRLLYRSRRFALEVLDARKAHRLQFAGGHGCEARGLPCAIIKACAVPAWLLRAGIEILTRIDVGEHDGAIRRAPGF